MLLRVERVAEAVADLALELLRVGLVELRLDDGALGLAGLGDEFLDAGDDLLDLAVGELDGVDDALFGDLAGAGLDHRDAVLGADDHDVELDSRAARSRSG